MNDVVAVIDRPALDGAHTSAIDTGRVIFDTPSLTLFTSGSTGVPKAVHLNHRAVANNASGLVVHTGLTHNDRLLHVMPIYHTNGINNQILAPFLIGAQVVFAPRFRAPEMPKLMVRYQPTLVSGVPTMYSRMLAQEFSDEAKCNLRMLRCGSAPITLDLQRRIEEEFGCPVVVSYGLSEATCTSTMNPPNDRRVGSIGTTLANQTVALLDLDETGRPDPKSIAGGWLRTGDLGWFDEEGYLFITGRA